MIPEMRNFQNDAIREAVLSAHSAVAYILPPWLREFALEGNTERDTGLLATVRVDSRYRRASVIVYPMFFTQTPQEQRDTLRHEYVHILMGGLTEVLTEMHSKNPMIEYHHEAATEDIARLLEQQERGNA